MIKHAVVLAALLSTACASGPRTLEGRELSAIEACSQLAKIKAMPIKADSPATDPYHLVLRSDPKSASACLIDRITDPTPMADPRFEPTKVDGFAVGDLAFFILSDLGVVSFEGVLPREVAQQLTDRGVFAYFDWIKRPGNRAWLQ